MKSIDRIREIVSDIYYSEKGRDYALYAVLCFGIVGLGVAQSAKRNFEKYQDKAEIQKYDVNGDGKLERVLKLNINGEEVRREIVQTSNTLEFIEIDSN